MRGIINLRARRLVAPNIGSAELAYRRREQERRKEREEDAYIDSSQRTPEELEQRRLDRLQRKLYRDSEDVSQLTPPQRAARDLEIARNEVNEVYNSPEVLQLDMQTSEGRRRLRELVAEARDVRRAAEARERAPEYMNIANNNGPVQVESIGTGGIIPERARWGREAGQRAMQAARREVDAVYESPEGLVAQKLGDRRRLHQLMAEARERRLLEEAQSNMTPAQIAASARTELGLRQFFPKFFGGYTKHRKTRGRKSRGTRRRRR